MLALLAGALCIGPRAARAAPDAADSLAAAPAERPLAAFAAPRVRAWQVGFLRPDRMEHAGLSFALTSALVIASRDRRLAAGAVLSLGLGKELWDRRGSGGFDPVDLAAGATGVGVAVILVRARGD